MKMPFAISLLMFVVAMHARGATGADVTNVENDLSATGQVASANSSRSNYPSSRPIGPYLAQNPWVFTADGLILHRSNASSSPLVYGLVNGSPAPVFNTDQLGADTSAGPRLSLRRVSQTGSGFELAYWGIDGWLDSAELKPGQYLVHADVTGQGPPATTALPMLYASRIHTVEANWWGKPWGWITPMVGFRWLRLGESFNLDGGFETGGGVIDYNLNYRTRNDLFGGQIGFIGMLWDNGPLSIFATTKAGCYLNDSTMRLNYTQSAFLPGGGFIRSRSGTAASFVGELGLTAQWRLGNHVALRGGYQLYWIEGVALAPDQQTTYNVFLNQGGPNTSGGVFLHGAFAGMQVSW